MRFKSVAGAAILGVILGGAVSLVPGASPAAIAAPSAEKLAELRPAIDMGLASNDVAVQAWAIRAAGLTGAKDLQPALLEGLKNANAPVRVAAAMAMIDAKFKVDDARKVLVTELSSGDASTRAFILDRVMPVIDAKMRRDILSKALDAVKDAAAERQIVLWISRRGTAEDFTLLDRAATLSTEKRKIWVDAAVSSARPELIEFARKLGRSKDIAVRADAAEIALGIPTPEARDLLRSLQSQVAADFGLRIGFHLASLGDVDALRAVRALALDTAATEGERMDALALLRDRNAALLSFADLSGMLKEAERSVAFRTRVYEVMAATKSPEGRAAIDELVNGLFADDRLYGIAALGYTGDAAALESLRKILASPGEPAIRTAAARAIGHLGGDTAATPLLESLRVERAQEVRIALIEALADTRSQLAAVPLGYLLSQQNDDISRAAILALQKVGSRDVVPTLETASSTYRSPEIRWLAVVTLTRIDPEIGRLRLLQALDRPPANFYKDLEDLPAALLEEIDGYLLGHANPEIREAALLRVLNRPDGGLSVLRGHAESSRSPDVRKQAITLLTGLADPGDKALFQKLLSDTDRTIRLQALTALAELKDPELRSFFEGYLKHADLVMQLIGTYAILRLER